MKRIIIILVAIVLVIPLIFIFISNDSKDVKKAIENANKYLKENELDDCLFSNVLQTNLKKSLVYNVGENKTLIIYKKENYSYENNKLKKVNKLDYKVVDTTKEALNEEVGSYVLTRGYKKINDKGNALYLVSEFIDNTNNEFVISNEEENKSLRYVNFDSTINIYQMGYDNEKLDVFINNFTSSLKYNNIFVPKGQYIIEDNFDVNVSNKAYYGYETTIITNDSFNPSGYNSGCLFYVHNNISSIKIFGFKVNVEVNKKLDNPLLGFLSARDIDGLVVDNCAFYLPSQASIYSSSGVLDLFTGWKNVIIRNCRFENYTSTKAGGGIGIRDIYKKGCSNALIENNYIYSNCKDEVIAVFSGGDTSLYPNETGGGYIEDVIFKNNTIIGGKPNEDIGPRVVGLTIGYQLSPVRNISYIENTIEMYSANYLLLYGKADTVSFKNNNVKIDASYQDELYTIVCHNSKADEGKNITIDNNNFEFINNSSMYTIAQANEELVFSKNNINCSKIYRVFDSKSLFEHNIINADTISKAVYHNVKNTKDNEINCNYLTIVFELYNLNIIDDMIIEDKVKCNTISANFMMFNGNSIKFNGHKITFNNFKFDATNVESKYYYIAYNTSVINDHCEIDFINSDLSIFNDEKHNFVSKDDENKVTINYVK